MLQKNENASYLNETYLIYYVHTFFVDTVLNNNGFFIAVH